MIKPPPQPRSDTPPDDPGTGAESAPFGSKGSEIGDAIGRQLKTLFDDVAAEPVPDKLRELLEELERTSGKTK
ncbi:MAG: NepR family anti-sigma factor [Hyphomicrobiaceae bacterium]